VKCKGGDSGAGCSDNAAFIAAIEAGDVAAMARAVEGGASVTAGLDEYGATALEFAAHKGHSSQRCSGSWGRGQTSM
jgi:hypothetical protein